MLSTGLKIVSPVNSFIRKDRYFRLRDLKEYALTAVFHVRGVCRKAKRVGKTKSTKLIMEQMNFHKQKLYSLILAGVAFIALILPWMNLSFFGSLNGFRSWGFLTLAGVAGVVIACFMGDKALAFDETFKKIALASFAAIAAGALIFFIRISGTGPGIGSGFGLWLALLAGLAGVAWVMGLIKLPDNKKPPIS